MAKDPAFLFYPNDWIGGTMGMTFEEKGAYMEVLMMQFNRGHMTDHMIRQTVGQLWDNIKDKFCKDANGLWYNDRLEIEKEKRKAYTESRKNNKKGKNQYSKKTGHTTKHMKGHMENVNVNVNKDVINLDKGVKGEKVFVRENVSLKQKEIETLKSKHTKKEIEWMFDKLSAYKMSKGKKYKSDYGAINSWVTDNLKEHKVKNQNQELRTLRDKREIENLKNLNRMDDSLKLIFDNENEQLSGNSVESKKH